MDARTRIKPEAGTTPDASAERRWIKISPINKRRWENFKANRRGYWSLWIFLALFLIDRIGVLGFFLADLGVDVGIERRLREQLECGYESERRDKKRVAKLHGFSLGWREYRNREWPILARSAAVPVGNASR